jgi:hypothetical protein
MTAAVRHSDPASGALVSFLSLNILTSLLHRSCASASTAMQPFMPLARLVP